MTTRRLHVRVGGKVGGPFEWEQVRRGVELGKLLPDHEASADGQTWFRLETIWQELVGDPTLRESSQHPAGAGSNANTTSLSLPSLLVDMDRADSHPEILANESVGEHGPGTPPRETPAGSVACPAYRPGLYVSLVVALFITGSVYLFMGLNTVFVMFTTQYGDLTSRIDLQRKLGVIAPIAELVMSTLWLAWLHNVLSRLRESHRRLASERFSIRVATYFLPVIGAVVFAGFLERLFQAFQQGTRKKIRSSPPGVTGGIVLRLLVWVGYLAAIGTYFWLLSVTTRLDEARRLANIAADGPKAAEIQRNAGVAMRQIAASIQAPTIIIFGLAIFIALTSAGIMLMNYRYASALDPKITAWDDPSEGSLN